MLDQFLISKKEIGKFKLTLKNSLGLSCEKVTQLPRVFNTLQIKNAIENISFIDIEEKIVPEILTKVMEFILKDFFLYMHQTGLYNRQFKLWATLANITQLSIFSLQKGIFKKNDLNTYMIDFFIDPKIPCIKAIINENEKTDYSDFKMYLSKALTDNITNRLKGIFYFLKPELNDDFIKNLTLLTNGLDPILKYESIINNTKDTSLNLINYKYKKYVFEPIYPQLKLIKREELEVN